jgi:uncharacterized iron-regulated membrane protein
MALPKFMRTTHKWTGILFSLVFVNLAVTGGFLLVKKTYAWIQPPTRSGSPGSVEDFITTRKLITVVLSQGHEDFQRLEDIDRVDFRPAMRVFKVRSRHNHAEIQVDAVSGAVLQKDWRLSDALESLHDGSFFGAWVHDMLMPVTAGVLFFLTASGVYLWVRPLATRRRRAASR